MINKIETIFQSNRVFIFLVIFRWASLIPALLTLNETNTLLPPLLVFILALAVNGVVSFFNRPLNKLVIDSPILLGADLLFSAFILAVSGGSHSPYYLYALSPLLAGALFFQVRGALMASLIFMPLYILANLFSQTPSDNIVLASQLAGIWMLPLLFAYPSTLLKSVNQTTAELSAAHRQLEILHDLTVLLQAAPDLISVQERVLGAVVTDLGFSKAVVAMVDPSREEIGGWLVYPPDDSFPQTKPLPSNLKTAKSSRRCSTATISPPKIKPSSTTHNSTTGSTRINGSSCRFI
ncbi:MAG: hypothetical protein IPP55_17285 [Anaerolineales bacterium]|nr:hypothetical protein [Anaerolineales bacterium]